VSQPDLKQQPDFTLSYDDLPRHCTLLREYFDDDVKITAPARKLERHDRLRIRVRAAVSAARWIGIGLLALCLIVFGGAVHHHRPLFSLGACVVAAAFGLLVFVFLCAVRCASLADAMSRALSQNTIIATNHGRLLIESDGPLGRQSSDISRDQLRELRVVRTLPVTKWSDEQDMSALQILLTDGRTVQIGVGRDLRELRWLAGTLRGFLDGARQTLTRSDGKEHVAI